MCSFPEGESTRDSDPVCFMVNGKKYFQTIFQHIERVSLATVHIYSNML